MNILIIFVYIYMTDKEEEYEMKSSSNIYEFLLNNTQSNLFKKIQKKK